MLEESYFIEIEPFEKTKNIFYTLLQVLYRRHVLKNYENKLRFIDGTILEIDK